MMGNANYTTPIPPLTDVTSALTAYTAAVADAAGGGRELIAIRNARHAELVSLMRLLAIYVMGACGDDLAVLISSGAPSRSRRGRPSESSRRR